jgi:hypothetical protein
LRARDVAVSDYHDFFNAITDPPPITPRASHVSFDVHWQGGGAPTSIRDAEFGFEGVFIGSDARIDFVAMDDDSAVVYRSDPDGQVSLDAAVGRERNGAFFR